MFYAEMMFEKSEDLCADCSAPDTSWAVLNRGVFICEQCCSVHRSLGCHVSRVKSVRKGNWRSHQLRMMKMLHNGTANNFWEHSLSDSRCSKKKPQPTDPIHPNKFEFIRSKHQDLAFAFKSRDSCTQEDLDQQLHASVRTSNLGTSLRLLAHGADPNYFFQEKGNSAMHVAAHMGQMEQIELLLVYGANPTALDAKGNVPAACARLAGFVEVEKAVIESTYEVTDRLCAFLCEKRPSHRDNRHFFVPQISDCAVKPQVCHPAKIKLKSLPNSLFEELVCDIYDEVDRRENISVCENAAKGKDTWAPFLPVNPDLTTMRNQGRQKLATLSDEDFSTLVWNILEDCERRQTPVIIQNNKILSQLMDYEPLYDSVASDDDYARLECRNKVQTNVGTDMTDKRDEKNEANEKPMDEFTELREEMAKLRIQCEKLKKENSELRMMVDNVKIEEKSASNAEITQDDTTPQSPRPSSLYNIAQKFINNSHGEISHKPIPPEKVINLTNNVTKSLKELSTLMRASQCGNNFTPCMERVRCAVMDLSKIFPLGMGDEAMGASLHALYTNAIRLQAICTDLDAVVAASVDKMRNCALNMAKATKHIVTLYQQ